MYFSDTRKWAFENRELNKAVTQAYNDFVMELNQQAIERICILPQIPTWAPEWAADELKRMLDKGAKAVEFHPFDLAQPIYSDAWDATFGLAAEAGVPLCCHIGDGAGVPYPPNERGSSWAHFSIAPFSIAKYIPQFVFSGAFERFPKLQVSVAECRIGWLPFLFTWMDRQVEIRPPDPTVNLSMMPTDYIKRNMTFTFEEDRLGAQDDPVRLVDAQGRRGLGLRLPARARDVAGSDRHARQDARRLDGRREAVRHMRPLREGLQRKNAGPGIMVSMMMDRAQQHRAVATASLRGRARGPRAEGVGSAQPGAERL